MKFQSAPGSPVPLAACAFRLGTDLYDGFIDIHNPGSENSKRRELGRISRLHRGRARLTATRRAIPRPM